MSTQTCGATGEITLPITVDEMPLHGWWTHRLPCLLPLRYRRRRRIRPCLNFLAACLLPPLLVPRRPCLPVLPARCPHITRAQAQKRKTRCTPTVVCATITSCRSSAPFLLLPLGPLTMQAGMPSFLRGIPRSQACRTTGEGYAHDPRPSHGFATRAAAPQLTHMLIIRDLVR